MSIKAMQQAIDALETCRIRSVSEWSVEDVTPKNITEAIQALRTAIQQAAQAKTDVRCEGCGYMTHHREHMGCVRAAKQFTHPAPGVPVGQAPSVWNSIQIASWIGSQLMREPSTFERNAVCKFVRSLGRHPTLLKHSPKDTHLAPGVPDDSKRLDYLQERGATIDLIPGVADFYPMQFRVGGLHSSANTDVRAAIDAAMLASSQSQKGGE